MTTTFFDLGKLRPNFRGEYSGQTNYEFNDVVNYGANAYVYINLVPEAGMPVTDTIHWAQLAHGVRYRGAWQTNMTYLKDDLVVDGGSSYIAKTEIVLSNLMPHEDAARWDMAMQGSDTSLKKTGDTMTGTLTMAGPLALQLVLEKAQIKAMPPAQVEPVDLKTQGTVYSTVNANTAWTFNFRGDAATSLDSMMAIGQSISCTYIATMGAAGYVPNVYQIDGVAVTPKWIGGAQPSPNTSCIDMYSFTLLKIAAASFLLIASRSKAA